MSSAEIYQFPSTPTGEVREKRGPQVEDGYTRIANELFEAVTNAHTCPVTLRQMRVVLAVIRKTYGFNKKVDRISDGQLAAETGLSRQNVNKAKRELIAMHVLYLDGHKLGVNKHCEQWNFSAKPEKDNLRQTRVSVSKPETKSVSKSGSHKRQKDSNTSTNVEERIGEPTRDESIEDDSTSKPQLPNCPHSEIIELWAEIMPDKPQPSKNMWQGTERARHLAARWKAGFTIKHERTGEPLYTDLQSGLDWWGRFFRFLRKSEFLMGDNRWFKLAWVAKRENFVKIMEMDYHDGGVA
ncbi:replication protein [Vreelandella venusta]|uniref:replication protein n=1 Tax=Vreelandella venusta TaxID=44935 RepID=UPI00200CDF7C|nr:replication protein [Halomonas venusta]UQI42724.1 replication protein [Halomonas venusta]